MTTYISHRGAFIDADRLRRLAFTDNDHTDNERALRVALQDALVLASIYRGGKWTEGVAGEAAIFYHEVDVAHRLDVLAKVAPFATPAPWVLDLTEPRYIRDQHMNQTIGSVNLRADDARLIVEMRNALPFLLMSRRIADKTP